MENVQKCRVFFGSSNWCNVGMIAMAGDADQKYVLEECAVGEVMAGNL